MTEAELKTLAKKVLDQHQKKKRNAVWIRGHLYVETTGMTYQEINSLMDLGVTCKFEDHKTWLSHAHLKLLAI